MGHTHPYILSHIVQDSGAEVSCHSSPCLKTGDQKSESSKQWINFKCRPILGNGKWTIAYMNLAY